ncbi:putative protein of unknown function (DUF890) [Lyophyllum shimeji]|uniref:U6 small nuclear RNA (adenine-(43)-N(6))-methyltransferase n=1 Tax=Lyophyllum shimeji TaxID=47721 RepID=A0A9P3PX54_LYOSH|nr:putative protein of unknown function (DUF890) [Lyophyllum shimeji]
MHSRNPYRLPPDFKALACSHPPLAKHLQGDTIDFHDDAAQRCLTQALLKRDFNLDIQLPPDRLCPPVPNRLNYVLWIQDIVSNFRDAVRFVSGTGEVTVRGLDIGTGASAIYPLLACTLEPTWTFVATELDDRSFTYARDNVRSNGLSDRIRVVKIDANMSDSAISGPDGRVGEPYFGFDRLLAGAWDGDGNAGYRSDYYLEPMISAKQEAETDDGAEIQFTMCNPPFYSSAEDVAQSEARKEHTAFGVCTGAPVEMITPGGEAWFVGTMVRESVGLRKTQEVGAGIVELDDGRGKRRRVDGEATQATEAAVTAEVSTLSPETTTAQRKEKRKVLRWYTSMLGKLSSVVEVVDIFKELGITNYAITEFVQGHTRRWAVGWSVGPWRLGDDIARITNPNPTLQRLLPPRNTLRSTVGVVRGDIGERLLGVLSSVEGARVTLLDETEGTGGGSGAGDDATNGQDTVPKSVVCKLVVSVASDTWSRAARRKRKRGDAQGDALAGDAAACFTPAEVRSDPALVCAITVLSGGQGTELDMEVRWLYGRNRALLESFASHVGKKVRLEMVAIGGVR